MIEFIIGFLLGGSMMCIFASQRWDDFKLYLSTLYEDLTDDQKRVIDDISRFF